MSDLICYNATKVPTKGFGFINLGATCYFNAVTQALLSCSSFNALLSQTFFLPNQINPAIPFQNLIQQPNQPQGAALIWQAMIRAGCPLDSSQQCAGEALILLIDILEKAKSEPQIDIPRLFTYRTETSFFCYNCKQWKTVGKSNNIIFNIEAEWTSDDIYDDESISKFNPRFDAFSSGNNTTLDMSDYMLKSASRAEFGYVCSYCKSTEPKLRKDVLTMVPEILIVQAKKYNNRLQKLPGTTKFQPMLMFQGSHGNTLRYEAVAQIEHSGNLSGGHYWAICKRQNGWWILNDMSATPTTAGFAPTSNTYIVLYHIMSA